MITRTTARIHSVTDLSPTAREIVFVPETPLTFLAGAFVNIFIPSEDGPKRRAYSISSDPSDATTFALSIRRVIGGEVSPFFWQPDVIGKTIDIMGPLGMNTVDKLTRPRVFLVGFGIGVSVIKSLAHHLSTAPHVEELIILTGHRNQTEHLYKDMFEDLAQNDPRISVRTAFSDPHATDDATRKGYVHEHLDGLTFDGSDVYLCGADVPCELFQKTVAALGATDVRYSIESFH